MECASPDTLAQRALVYLFRNSMNVLAQGVPGVPSELAPDYWPGRYSIIIKYLPHLCTIWVHFKGKYFIIDEKS